MTLNQDLINLTVHNTVLNSTRLNTVHLTQYAGFIILYDEHDKNLSFFLFEVKGERKVSN